MRPVPVHMQARGGAIKAEVNIVYLSMSWAPETGVLVFPLINYWLRIR